MNLAPASTIDYGLPSKKMDCLESRSVQRKCALKVGPWPERETGQTDIDDYLALIVNYQI